MIDYSDQIFKGEMSNRERESEKKLWTSIFNVYAPIKLVIFLIERINWLRHLKALVNEGISVLKFESFYSLTHSTKRLFIEGNFTSTE